MFPTEMPPTPVPQSHLLAQGQGCLCPQVVLAGLPEDGPQAHRDPLAQDPAVAAPAAIPANPNCWDPAKVADTIMAVVAAAMESSYYELPAADGQLAPFWAPWGFCGPVLKQSV